MLPIARVGEAELVKAIPLVIKYNEPLGVLNDYRAPRKIVNVPDNQMFFVDSA